MGSESTLWWTSFAVLLLLFAVTDANAVLPTAGGGLEAERTYLVVVTDPHGWFSGHRHNEKFTADYASLSSFADRFRTKAASLKDCEVFMFENGDLVDGGGLTDEKDGKKLVFPILDDIGFDARTVGNHELYVGSTIQTLRFPGVFVTSNVVDAKTRKPFGARYKVIPMRRGKDAGNVLVFGFLYNMASYDSSVAFVETVASAVKSDWFSEALKGTPDVRFVVVLAHMDYKDALLKTILSAIRAKTSETLPVVFVTGHTHARRSTYLDPFAFSFETGRYLDTIGVLSFPTTKPSSATKMLDVRHDYLDANADVLFNFLGDDEDSDTETDKARAIRKRLRTVRQQLELDRVVGYIPVSLSIEVGLDHPLSLVRYWIQRVAPKSLLNEGTQCPGFFLSGSGNLRYDLLRGPVVVDDLWAVAPFQEGFKVVRCVPGSILLDTIARLPTKLMTTSEDTEQVGAVRRPFHPSLPLFVHSDLKKISKSKSYDLIFGLYESAMVLKFLNENAKRVQYSAEPFRQSENLSQHSLWVEYFTSKKYLVEDVVVEVGRNEISEPSQLLVAEQ